MIEEIPPDPTPELPPDLPPIEEEPEPEPVPAQKRRGRPPGAKNKPKVLEELKPKVLEEPPKKVEKPRPKVEKPKVEEESSESEGDVETAVNFFSAHIGNMQRRSLDAKRDSWRNLFR